MNEIQCLNDEVLNYADGYEYEDYEENDNFYFTPDDCNMNSDERNAHINTINSEIQNIKNEVYSQDTNYYFDTDIQFLKNELRKLMEDYDNITFNDNKRCYGCGSLGHLIRQCNRVHSHSPTTQGYKNEGLVYNEQCHNDYYAEPINSIGINSRESQESENQIDGSYSGEQIDSPSMDNVCHPIRIMALSVGTPYTKAIDKNHPDTSDRNIEKTKAAHEFDSTPFLSETDANSYQDEIAEDVRKVQNKEFDKQIGLNNNSYSYTPIKSEIRFMDQETRPRAMSCPNLRTVTATSNFRDYDNKNVECFGKIVNILKEPTIALVENIVTPKNVHKISEKSESKSHQNIVHTNSEIPNKIHYFRCFILFLLHVAFLLSFKIKLFVKYSGIHASVRKSKWRPVEKKSTKNENGTLNYTHPCHDVFSTQRYSNEDFNDIRNKENAKRLSILTQMMSKYKNDYLKLFYIDLHNLLREI